MRFAIEGYDVGDTNVAVTLAVLFACKHPVRRSHKYTLPLIFVHEHTCGLKELPLSDTCKITYPSCSAPSPPPPPPQKKKKKKKEKEKKKEKTLL